MVFFFSFSATLREVMLEKRKEHGEDYGSKRGRKQESLTRRITKKSCREWINDREVKSVYFLIRKKTKKEGESVSSFLIIA